MYVGQPVVGNRRERGAAETAAALVEVGYEVLLTVLDREAAMKLDSPKTRVLTKVGEDAAEAAMHGIGGGAAQEEPQERVSSNVSGQTHMTLGDIAQGFAEAEVTAEGTYSTEWVHQSYIEPQTCVAAPDYMGGVTLHASTQGSSARGRWWRRHWVCRTIRCGSCRCRWGRFRRQVRADRAADGRRGAGGAPPGAPRVYAQRGYPLTANPTRRTRSR
ncbi:MAG: molybdopterin cofactor-binding domain-containing protein [Thermomicrobiales bacterium]